MAEGKVGASRMWRRGFRTLAAAAMCAGVMAGAGVLGFSAGTAGATTDPIKVTPPLAAFPTTPVGQVSFATVTVTNNISTPILINWTDEYATLAGTPFSIVNSTCEFGITPGTTCEIVFEFAPTKTGEATLALPVYVYGETDTPNSATGFYGSVFLAGYGSGGLTVSPSHLTFATTGVGDNSHFQTVSISNNSQGGVYHIESVSLSDTTDYSITGTSCTGTTVPSLAVDYCTIDVQFNPASLGVNNASLTIVVGTTIDGTVRPQVTPALTSKITIALNGTGIPNTTASVTPTSLTFVDVPVHTASGSQYVTVSNDGTNPLVFGKATPVIEGPTKTEFKVVVDTCQTVHIAPGETCQVYVTFNPTKVANTITAELTLAANASNTGVNPLIVKLTGDSVTSILSVTATPTELTFGTTPVGRMTGVQYVTLTNNGQSVGLATTTVTVSTNYTVVSNSCKGITFGPGTTCKIGVVFAPTATGIDDGQLTVTINGHMLVVPLYGSASSAYSETVSPKSLSFGTVAKGAEKILPVIVTNTGTKTITAVTAILTSGDTSFTVGTNGCAGVTLPPGANCVIQVIFTPDAVATLTGMLQLSGTAGFKEVPLSGKGANTTATISPTTLTFGTVPVHTTSAPQKITVTDTGTVPLVIGTAGTLSGHNEASFTVVTPNTCATRTVTPGKSCTIYVMFDPSSNTATQSAVLTVHANVSGTGTAPLTVVLKGSASSPATGVTASPTSLTFGKVGVGTSSGRDYVTITNNGQAVDLGTATVTGVHAADYTLSADSCTPPIQLAKGATCRIGVTFDPSVLHHDDATLIVPVTGGQAVEVPLSGTGVADTTVSVSPASLTFPTLYVGQTSPQELVTVTNTGLNPLIVTTVAPKQGLFPSDFKVVTTTCKRSMTTPITQGGTCTFGVVFAPTVKGHLTATLLITDNALSGPQVVELTGNATAPGTGYDLVGSDGGVFVFDAPGQTGGFFGSLPGIHVVPVKPIVGIVPTVDDQGYFLVGADGGVFAFGDAPFLGSLPGIHVTPNQPITGIVAANTDKGYFLVGRDGGVFAFGSVPFLGSLPGEGISVNNIIGIASTANGNGYWLISATGTVWGFGAAAHLGTAKGTASPVSAIAGTATGLGYWVAMQNGGVDAFGTATKFGTLPAINVTPVQPVIGIVPTAHYTGYWLLGSDGGVFAFNAPFVGSLPGLGIHVNNIVGAVPN